MSARDERLAAPAGNARPVDMRAADDARLKAKALARWENEGGAWSREQAWAAAGRVGDPPV